MSRVFRGELWPVAEPGSRVGATLTVEGDRVLLAIGDATIGDWQRSDISVRSQPDGYHLTAEGEELIFLTSHTGLVAALTGTAESASLKTRLAEAQRAVRPPSQPAKVTATENYPALRVVALIYRGVGYLIVALAVLSVVAFFLTQQTVTIGDTSVGLVFAIVAAAYAALIGLVMIAAADLLRVAVAVERHTRHTAVLVEEILANSNARQS